MAPCLVWTSRGGCSGERCRGPLWTSSAVRGEVGHPGAKRLRTGTERPGRGLSETRGEPRQQRPHSHLTQVYGLHSELPPGYELREHCICLARLRSSQGDLEVAVGMGGIPGHSRVVSRGGQSIRFSASFLWDSTARWRRRRGLAGLVRKSDRGVNAGHYPDEAVKQEQAPEQESARSRNLFIRGKCAIHVCDDEDNDIDGSL